MERHRRWHMLIFSLNKNHFWLPFTFTSLYSATKMLVAEKTKPELQWFRYHPEACLRIRCHNCQNLIDNLLLFCNTRLSIFTDSIQETISLLNKLFSISVWNIMVSLAKDKNSNTNQTFCEKTRIWEWYTIIQTVLELRIFMPPIHQCWCVHTGP